MTSNISSYFSIAAILSGTYACSLINSPDELKPSGSETGGMGGGSINGDGDSDTGGMSGDTGGTSGDGDGDTGGTSGDGDGDTGGTSGDGDGDTGGTSGDGDTGGMSGDGDMVVPEPPTAGLVVVAAQEEDTGTRVLSVLDPVTGNEIDREAVPVISVTYDPTKFVWYVFLSNQVSPSNNTLAELQVRYYDTNNGWTVISSVANLPPPVLRGNEGSAGSGMSPTAQFTPVVLNNRLAYVSQTLQGSTARQAFTVLDTTDLLDVQHLDTTPNTQTDEQIVGLVGRRGSQTNAMSPGGIVSLMMRSGCTASGECRLAAQPFVVGNDVSVLDSEEIDPIAGTPAFTSTAFTSAGERQFMGGHVVAFRPSSTPDVRTWQFDPQEPLNTAASQSVCFDTDCTRPTSQGFGGMAVSQCNDAKIVSDALGEELWAIHPNGSVSTVDLGHTGELVRVDTFAGDVLTMRPRTAVGAPALRAFALQTVGLGANARFNLVERPNWQPPLDLEPLNFALRGPFKPTCQMPAAP